MNKVVEILMKRDGMSQEEAEDRVREVRDIMEDCSFDPEECEEIVMDELGLEMDYLMDMLYFE